MKRTFYQLVLAAEKIVDGTNCASCEYSKDAKSKPAKEVKLNKQGGTIPADDEEMQRAKEADLITMPGTGSHENVFLCKHEKVAQYINERMCCAFWDAPGTLRAYGKQAIGK